MEHPGRHSAVAQTLVRELRIFPRCFPLLLSMFVTLCLAGLAWLVIPDFVDPDKMPAPAQLMKVAAVAFFFPALFEEIVFRGVLNPLQTGWSITVSTSLFIVWHPIAAFLLIPEALPYMTDPRFLVFVALFGVAFCFMRKWTGSLWTPILCHWMLTVLWKSLGGAQFLT